MLKIITSVGWKLRREQLLRGTAVFFLVAILASILSSYILVQSNFSGTVVFWARLFNALLLLLLLVGGILMPFWHRYSVSRLARFIEEQQPQLQQGLSTVVELRDGNTAVDLELQSLLEQDVKRRLTRLSLPRFYNPKGSLLSLLTLVISILLSIYLSFAGPEAYRYSLNYLWGDWSSSNSSPLYSITVSPGSVKVAKHADVEIRAGLRGFDSERVKLHVQYKEDPGWEELRMQTDAMSGDFVFLFFDVRDPMDYFVEADGIRSGIHTLVVSEIPRVESLGIHLVFPSYTRLNPVNQTDQGDIQALVGTKAEVRIETDQLIRGAVIKLDEGGDILLSPNYEKEYIGSFKVTGNDYYRIHLQNQEGVWSPGTEEYVIMAVADQPPQISFKQPGRDRRVSNIEEVFTELMVADDYGVQSLDICYSVNGDAEEDISLEPVFGNAPFTMGYTFYLEELTLEPGDFISYYARASDSVSSSETDIFFLEVQPYDREYYQSQTGGMGMPGGDSQDLVLSKRQKQIIVASFKLQKDEALTPDKEFKEKSQTTALIQQRLQGEVHAIADRLERRQAVTDERFLKMRQYLRQAMSHMEPAHERLNQLEPRRALPHEQKAFRELLRAESLFKEIQVSFGQVQGGSGSSPEELADLVDLELDRTKNQYETVQQNQQFQQEHQLDDAMEKLKELTRRQEQTAERSRRMAGQKSSNHYLSKNQLVDEVESLGRQLERLSRRQQQTQLSKVSNELQQAARDLRQAAGVGGQGLERQQMFSQRATERLRTAREVLAKQRQDQISKRIETLSSDAHEMLDQQSHILKGIEGTGQRLKDKKVDQESIRQIRNLLREKQKLQRKLSRVEGELHQVANQAAYQEPQVSRKLKQAGNRVREDFLSEKMQEGSRLLSRGWIDLAREREKGVNEGLEILAKGLEEAIKFLGKKESPGLDDHLKRAQAAIADLVESLDSLRKRVSQFQVGSQEGLGQDTDVSESSGNTQGGEGPLGEGHYGSPQQGQLGSSKQSGSMPNLSGIDPRQVRREWQERIQEAESVRRLLMKEQSLERESAGLSQEMKELDLERILFDPEEIAHLRSQIIQGFQQLELKINRVLDQETENLVWLFQEEEVPDKFRDRVKEYYRNLSSERGDR